jgi:hypothetical protein
MRRAKLGYISGLFAIVVSATSCAPQPLIAPPSQPPPAPGKVETTVAQTAVVAQAQTITALPPTSTPITPTATATQTGTPTQSPTPTPAILFLFPTETLNPTILLEPTTSDTFSEDSTGESGGNVGGDQESEDKEEKSDFTGREWTCKILSKSPPNGTIISPKTEFKVRWVVKNTGTKTWPKKGVDVVFKAGARIHDRAYYDIPASVPSGGTVSIELTLTTPPRKDTYRTYWTLKVGKNEFCTLPISFEVR